MTSDQILAAVLLSLMLLPMAYFVYALVAATWLAVEPLGWAPYRRFLRRSRERTSMMMYGRFWFLMVWGTMIAVVFVIIVP